ncbi:HD-GYP domain-containing protein [Desulfonatronum thiosulfatophilum]|nr:HD domain-containing phosphohydrolase [Desulfonatronum thiosulfatophilum]
MDSNYLQIQPLLLMLTDKHFDFNIYLYQNDNYILYATPENFTEEHRSRLIRNGIENLYIDNSDKLTYELFIEKNLPDILESSKVPLQAKSKILYNHSLDVVESFFIQSGKEYLNKESYQKMVALVDNIYGFLEKNPYAIQSMRSLIATHYREYIHCINTALYAISLLIYHNEDSGRKLRKSFVRQVGVGALLHDIGKSKVHQSILSKPAALTSNEFEEVKKHPIYGLEMCQHMKLSQPVTQCVMFHHEKLDGSGYPSGTKNIPDHVRIVTIADMFDAITCDRPYRKHKVTGFEALKIISKDVERGKLDRAMVASFIRMISQGMIRL